LLRSAASESAGIEESIELGTDRLKEGGATDTLDQVVILALEVMLERSMYSTQR
jgi:hypothetical protein